MKQFSFLVLPVCLSAAEGAILYIRWSVWDTGWGCRSSPVVDAEESIYVLANDTDKMGVFRKSDTDGNLLWTIPTSNGWDSDTSGCLGNGGY